MYICIPNMKFLGLTVWQEVCTDDDANDDTNDDARRTKHDCKRLFG